MLLQLKNTRKYTMPSEKNNQTKNYSQYEFFWLINTFLSSLRGADFFNSKQSQGCWFPQLRRRQANCMMAYFFWYKSK